MNSEIGSDELRSATDDAAAACEPSRLNPVDVLRVGASGPRSRKLRTALSALGVSIGIAALIGVLGLSDSSRADLLDQIDRLGTNLITVESGAGFGAGDGALPADAAATIARIPTVETAAALYELDTSVYRSDYIDPGRTNAITVAAADPSLLDTVSGTVAEGRFLDEATSTYPVAVVGSVAAERLGIDDLAQRTFVQIGDDQVEVIGILDEFPLAADLDRSVLIGTVAAATYYDAPDTPSIIYTRVEPGSIDQTRALLPGTADPENPEEVTTSRPSDILEAQAAAETAYTDLFLGLGAVALLVGGVGIANVMVIAVIERRGEIGLRRAIGATRAHIRRQFITEATILSLLGGIAGVGIGIAVTAVYASIAGWQTVIPVGGVVAGLIAAVAIGVIAGLYPAMRAARLSPTEALRT
ncbi:MAG: ABC transporter permease [Acidimicrobiales bacterium]